MGRNEIKAKLSFPDLFFSGGNAPRTLETGSKRGPLVLIMKLRLDVLTHYPSRNKWNQKRREFKMRGPESVVKIDGKGFR